MKRWPTKTLGELVLPTAMRDPRENPTDEFSYVDIASVDNETKAIVTTKRIVGAQAPSRARKVIREGDVIVSTVRPNLNAVALVPGTLDNQICSTGFSILRPSEKVICGYLFAFVRSPFFIDCLVTRTTGASYPAINDGEVKNVPIPVPPLAEQERIVMLLDEADELRKLRAQADRRTADLISALFHEMFGNPEINPQGWPRGTLKSFGVDVRYGLGQPPEEDAQGVPILRATNIKHGYISEVGLIRVRREAVPPSRNAFLNADDVLVVRSGAYTGDVARVGERWAGSVAGYDLVVSAGEHLTGEFIASYLLSKFVQEQYFGGLKLRAAQPHLNSTQVDETPFFCPPLPLQREFAARVAAVRTIEAEQSTNRHRLDAVFNSLLHRMFEGEL